MPFGINLSASAPSSSALVPLLPRRAARRGRGERKGKTEREGRGGRGRVEKNGKQCKLVMKAGSSRHLDGFKLQSESESLLQSD